MIAAIPFKLECEEAVTDYGRFVAQPLEPGFGTTLGNALRRVLLSSLTGAAVTWVKVEGAMHEFSTVPHMKEDTMEFLLNVKTLRLRPLSGRPSRLYLDWRGAGEVTAAAITPTADFEVVNPQLHLATMDSAQAKLAVEFNVDLNKGYLAVEKQVRNELPSTAIAVDAIFSPVIRTNFKVEPLRIQAKECERLVLEVWTDATMSPGEALVRSARILTEQLTPFEGFSPQLHTPGPVSKITLPEEKYNLPIEELGLSVRARNSLKRGGITTLGQLLEKSIAELMKLEHFGEKAKEEVLNKLRESALSLREDE